MSADAVAEAVDAGASYLLRRLDARGKFVYRENMSPAVKLTAKYNWLRHAGTIYSLATFARWNQSADVLPRLHTAAEYLLRTTLMAVPVAPPGGYARLHLRTTDHVRRRDRRCHPKCDRSSPHHPQRSLGTRRTLVPRECPSAVQILNAICQPSVSNSSTQHP